MMEASSSQNDSHQKQSVFPLSGLRILEFQGIGPIPFAGMMLADMGAEIVCVLPKGRKVLFPHDPTMRGRRKIVWDINNKNDTKNLWKLIKKADILMEGYRPGIMESMKFPPDECLKVNPALIYARMTGWGQKGPKAHMAGHDINYLSLTGALDLIGEPEKPLFPLNLLADYAGGSLHLVIGICAALYERQKSGLGQVVDCAMIDGVASLLTPFYAAYGAGVWGRRGSNILDGGAHFYGTYKTADEKWLAVGPIEPKFYKKFVSIMNLEDEFTKENYLVNKKDWDSLKKQLEKIFLKKPLAYWSSLLEEADVCCTPVLTVEECLKHPHHLARKSYCGGLPMPAPRFSRTPTRQSHASQNWTIKDILENW